MLAFSKSIGSFRIKLSLGKYYDFAARLQNILLGGYKALGQEALGWERISYQDALWHIMSKPGYKEDIMSKNDREYLNSMKKSVKLLMIRSKAIL
ncbi:hypothetical protein AGMMS49992_29490 [Clostridia bacterium]|nr:hypothetical protein AGMMS49992_29490 [Clostridia bacterium]